MPRTEAIAHHEARERELIELEAQRPELLPWLRPLRRSLASLYDDTWADVSSLVSPHREPDMPILSDAIVAIEAVRVREHVRAVLEVALGTEDLAAVKEMDELTLLEHVVNSNELQLGSPALNAAVQLAALPLFIACARNVATEAEWTHRYCQVCGALPVFAEVLGLERTRQLRCGRCCTRWMTAVLVCPFCGETDHARLGSLVPEGPQGQICWVETCSTCHGYIKVRAALRSMVAESVLVEDARTIDLDLVAEERGYARPPGVVRPVQLRLTTAGGN